MSYPCELQVLTAQSTLSVRTRTSIGKLPQIMGQHYGEIAGYLDELGQQPAGPAYTAYYNMDMQDLDVEIGFPVATGLPGRGAIQAGEIPGGSFATCLYKGPYNEIELAYNALTAWTQENGYETTGVAYEFYLNDPTQTAPQELLTQVRFPLK